jgi:phosphatidylinositol glycan class B
VFILLRGGPYADPMQLWVTVLNPWQWYCSTRTFSNSLETTLTIAALCYWPWEMLAGAEASKTRPLQQRDRVTR